MKFRVMVLRGCYVVQTTLGYRVKKHVQIRFLKKVLSCFYRNRWFVPSVMCHGPKGSKYNVATVPLDRVFLPQTYFAILFGSRGLTLQLLPEGCA